MKTLDEVQASDLVKTKRVTVMKTFFGKSYCVGKGVEMIVVKVGEHFLNVRFPHDKDDLMPHSIPITAIEVIR